MATQKQILANIANSLKSCGPSSTAGKEASSQNRVTHGLATHDNEHFYFLKDEDREKFAALKDRLEQEHQPQTETERILVRRMAESEWLRTRALRFQKCCLYEDQHVIATAPFALYMRYQANHERAFYKALKELQTLRKERNNEQIGFEAQQRIQAAETRAVEAHNWKKQEFEFKKNRVSSTSQPEKTQKEVPTPATAVESDLKNLEMAA
jgi:hypothetical protein